MALAKATASMSVAWYVYINNDQAIDYAGVALRGISNRTAFFP
jgi:hypothetical protein